MHDMTGTIRPKRLSYAVSLALASLMAGHAALAQENQAPQQPQPTPQQKQADAVGTESEMAKVIVSTRRSQQSGIQRKKNAATAIDSIVAEDVGTLPDRNIGEALSRMAGISLDRGDFGEGVNVSVRGNGSELTRVELDGQAVQSAGGSDLNGGGDGRGTEFRQLSADLIKSVDVVKGSTADMTEGSLGGGIRIETRNGLDFAKPFVSVRIAESQNSLNKKWTPDLNLITSKKFFNDRLGVLLNASTQKMENESHQFQTSANGRDGLTRSADLDNSPDKTFSFQPSSLDMNNPVSTTPWASYTGGGNTWNASTPLDILTKSAAAQTKADCYAQFPQLTSTSPELNGLSTANKTNAIGNRNTEINTCLNQWNDYTPSNIRHFVKRQTDERKNLDLRLDFKVNSELSVYGKGSYSRRRIDDNYLTYSLGNVSINPTLADGTNAYTDVNGVRIPAAGYYLLPNSYTSTVQGVAANFDPKTAVVDANHMLTQFTTNGSSVGIDQSRGITETNAKYLQLGGKFRRGGFSADFMVGDAESNFARGAVRSSISYVYGPTTAKLDPSGVWIYTLPDGTVLNNPANFVVPIVQGGALPTVSTSRLVQFENPKANETSERTAKLDLSYALPDSVPFFKRLKSGFNLRDTMSTAWNPIGYTVTPAIGTPGTEGYIPATTVPTANVRVNIQGCDNTAASLSTGGSPCVYGYVPGASPSLSGNYTMPMQDYRNLVASILGQQATATTLFNGADGRPAGMLSNWSQLDLFKLVNTLNLPNFNYNCLKECLGSDGKLYDQPLNKVRERSQAAYFMADFSLDHIPFTSRALPFGLELEGNLGYRYVRTTVRGTGNATFITIRKTAEYTEANPVTVTSTMSRTATINAVNHVFLPSYNLATWIVPDKAVLRYSAAKTSTRPPVSRLTASGTCTYDETKLNADTGQQDEDMSCQTFGNPNLQGQSNFNQNLSLELYPNKDTMFSIAGYKQEGKVGPYTTMKVDGVPVFAGSSEVDPATGTPLANMLFDYTTYINGPVSTRTGVELSTKTAFTFLPGLLRYTGFDANMTRQRSKPLRAYVDPITGAALPPPKESKLSYNWALWYDDGKLQARVAVQMVGRSFTCIAPCGDNVTYLRSYPMLNVGGATPAYNPGEPNWRDSRTFIDGKISYKINRNIDVFIEGRNLTNQTQTDTIGSVSYADGTPNLQNYAYAGRRITVGLNYRNL
jgi:TonB-dependent receptor